MGIGSFLGKVFGGGGAPPDREPVLFEIVESDWAAHSMLATPASMVTAFDPAFVLAWQEADNAGGLAAKSDSRSLVLALSPGAGGKKVQVKVSGSRLWRTMPPSQVTVRIAGKPHDVDLRRADHGFLFTKTIRLAGDATRLDIVVEARIPRPAPGVQEIQIESLDVNGRQEMI